MSLSENRSVAALAAGVRSVPTGLVTSTIGFGLLIAAAAGASTASTLQGRAEVLRAIDHQVTATVTPVRADAANRVGIGPAVTHWVYPAGIKHVEQTNGPLTATSYPQQLWVDSAGQQTAGPPDTLAIIEGAVWAILRTLLLTAFVLAVLAGAISTWQKRRLRSVGDAQWADLVHHLWEDL